MMQSIFRIGFKTLLWLVLAASALAQSAAADALYISTAA